MLSVGDIMLSMLFWIGFHTSYRVELRQPPIIFTQKEVLGKMLHGNRGLGKARAIFDPESQTIYLPNDFDFEDLVEQSHLLHELVHYVQFRNGRKYRCYNQLEPEAYRLQNHWLAGMGKSQGYSDLFIIFSGRCPQ